MEGEIFHTRADGPWVPPSLLYNGNRLSLPGVRRPSSGTNHTPASSAEIKERVELHFYSPFGPLWPAVGQTSPRSISPQKSTQILLICHPTLNTGKKIIIKKINVMLLARLLFGAFLLVIQRRLFSPQIILQIYRHSPTINVFLVKQN